MVRKLPENDITIETDDSFKTVIRCGKIVFRLMGRSTEDYPYLPDVLKTGSILVSQLTFKDMIRQTIFSISSSDNNVMMTGELLQAENNILKLTSLDGHRVSIRKVGLKDEYPAQKAIIPGKALSEISRILGDNADEDLSISITEQHVMFEFGNTILLSRLIDGDYFKIDQILTTDYETKLHLNKKEFMECIDRATLFVREGDKKPVVLNITDEIMDMKMDSSTGSMNDEMEVQKQGKDLAIGFNPRFVVDVLKAIDDEEIDMYMVNQKAPCFIKDSGESYIYMILPVNLPLE